MGRLFVGQHVVVEFDDRVLAHLQVVITAKMRRGESLLFSWRDSADSGSGRTATWLHPRSDLTFHYLRSRRPELNGAWVEALMLEANRPGGLQLMEEPGTSDGVALGHHNPISASGSTMIH